MVHRLRIWFVTLCWKTFFQAQIESCTKTLRPSGLNAVYSENGGRLRIVPPESTQPISPACADDEDGSTSPGAITTVGGYHDDARALNKGEHVGPTFSVNVGWARPATGNPDIDSVLKRFVGSTYYYCDCFPSDNVQHNTLQR